MKSILISIEPKYVVKILNGEKTIEIKKTMPKCDLPIDVYIYCTKDIKNKLCHVNYEPYGNKGYLATKLDCENEELNGKVVAKFTLNKVEEVNIFTITEDLCKKSMLDCLKICNYLKTDKGCWGYAWYIDNLVIFKEPKELSEFYSIVKEKVKTDCPLNCKGWCITNYDCQYYVEDDCWGGQLACKCPIKEVNTKKPLTKAPESWCYVEALL